MGRWYYLPSLLAIAVACYIAIMNPSSPLIAVHGDEPAPESLPQGSIRFISYNLFIRPPPINSNGEDFKDERLKDFTELVQNYDVLCLQELFVLASDRRDVFIRAAGAKGLRYSVYIPSKKFGIFPPRFIDGGVTILSRFPIIDTEHMLFDDATGSTADAWAAKGVVWAKIQLPADRGHIHVFSTHMQAHDHPDGRYSTVRLKQTVQMRGFIDRKTKDGAATLLAGDFNVNGRRARDDGMNDSDEYKQVWDVLTDTSKGGKKWQDVLRIFHNNEHVITGGDEFIVNRGVQPKSDEQASKRLDYVLLDPGSSPAGFKAESCTLNHMETPEYKPYVRISDHLAVEAIFTYQ